MQNSIVNSKYITSRTNLHTEQFRTKIHSLGKFWNNSITVSYKILYEILFDSYAIFPLLPKFKDITGYPANTTNNAFRNFPAKQVV